MWNAFKLQYVNEEKETFSIVKQITFVIHLLSFVSINSFKENTNKANKALTILNFTALGTVYLNEICSK